MASNGISVKVEGASGLLNKVRLLVPAIRRAAIDAVAEAALAIESDAKELAPVDTGRLRSSIKAEFSSNRLNASVATPVEYAIHVEFGTRYTRAQPFLGPAYEKNRLPFLANLKAAGLKL